MFGLMDLQEKVGDKEGKFCSLANEGKEQMMAAGGSDIVLGRKVTELQRGWMRLQSVIMGIQDRHRLHQALSDWNERGTA